MSNSDALSALESGSQGIFIANFGDFGLPQLLRELIGNKWWQ